MRIFTFFGIFTLTFLVVANTYAQDTKDLGLNYKAYVYKDYICTIKDAYYLNDNGSFEDSKQQTSFRLGSVGETFSVNRKSGVMSGELRNDNYATPVVLNYGSNLNSFNAHSVRLHKDTGVGVVQNIVIREFVNSEEKPFLYSANEIIMIGTCKHF